MAEFADGRAQLPGESVSRLYLDDLGFARPRLQVPFDGTAETLRQRLASFHIFPRR